MKTFEDAWRTADAIDGWLSLREAFLLWRAAHQTRPNGTMVEIGAYRGRSTCLLAETGRRVITYDPLTVGFGRENGMAIVAEDAELLAQNLAPYPNVTWNRWSAVSSPPPGRIDLLYIDGDHTGGRPQSDFRHFARVVTGFVAFHDFAVYPEVTAAVNMLVIEGFLVEVARAGSMWLGRKAS